MFDEDATRGLISLLEKAARDDASFCSDDELLEAVTVLERARRLLDAAEAQRLAQLDANDTCDRRFGMRTARWLAHECGLPAPVAQRRVRCAVAMRTYLPVTAEALAAGEIGFDHADAMARAANPRIASDIAEIESELLAPIPLCTFERWTQELRGVAEQLDQDGAYDPARDRDANRLHKRRGANNGLYVNGAFFGELADQMDQAIDDAGDSQFHLHRNDQKVVPGFKIPSRATLQALGLAELCRLGRANTDKPTGPPADITAVVEIDDDGARMTRTLTGTPLTDEVMALIGCDAIYATLLINGRRVPLDMGRSERLATANQRKAVRIRDGGCVFPGCGVHPNHTDVHHVVWWESGGRTDLANLACLCRHHHGVIHRKGWAMHANGDQTFTFSSASGATFVGQRHGHSTGPPP